MTRSKLVVAFALAALLFASVGQTQEKKIAMTPVSYDGLKQEILKQRGNVFVVDFWKSNCVPCRKAFPKLLDLHAKYANQGLAVAMVSRDSIDDSKGVEAANKFLQDSNSPFRNLLLNVPEEHWSKQMPIPCYYVFDRGGRWVKFGGADRGVDYQELENTVKQMLNEK